MDMEIRGASRLGTVAAAAATLLSLWYVAAQLFEWAGALGSSGGPNASSTWLGIIVLLVPSLLLGPAYVVLCAALYQVAPPERKAVSLAALALAVIYAALTGLVYSIQLTFVGPRLAAGETAGIELLLFRPYQSFLFAVDLFGYSLMCASTLFAAFALPNWPEARAAKALLVVNGLLLPSLALQMFVPELIYIGSMWGIVFPAAAASLWRMFHRSAD